MNAAAYACDTGGCDGDREVATPDGYVCRDCAARLAAEIREHEEHTDGGA